MSFLSGSIVRLSMLAMCAAAAMPASAGAPSPYFGRWTVSEDDPVFTARGRPYKMIDVAPCGRDFCGVSVSDSGACGQVLFRFLGKNAGMETLRGHGRWGAEQKNVVIYSYGGDSADNPASLELYVGDGVNFGGRSGNMPKYHSEYRRLGKARCAAK